MVRHGTLLVEEVSAELVAEVVTGMIVVAVGAVRNLLGKAVVAQPVSEGVPKTAAVVLAEPIVGLTAERSSVVVAGAVAAFALPVESQSGL